MLATDKDLFVDHIARRADNTAIIGFDSRPLERLETDLVRGAVRAVASDDVELVDGVALAEAEDKQSDDILRLLLDQIEVPYHRISA